MENKTRLEEQCSPEPIYVLNNNKHIKIPYIFYTVQFSSHQRPNLLREYWNLYTNLIFLISKHTSTL